MADLNPPPLFSPANAGGNAADSGVVTIIHGEIPRTVVGLVTGHPWLNSSRVEPDPDVTNAQSPPLPVHESNKSV